MAKLVVRLLGGFEVELDGRPVHYFESDRCRALLAFLIVEAGRPHRRETLASLLWPDRPDSVARANLRQALSSLRRALGDTRPHDQAPPGGGSLPPPFLLVTSTDLQFNTGSDFALDVSELETFAGNQGAGGAQLLPEALCADFLAGFGVPDSETFQAWVLGKQERYHGLALSILDEQCARFENLGEYDLAVEAARLELRMEPWLEAAHRRCMRALALGGRRTEALHQYEACCRALELELGVAPAGSTRSLYEAIRDGCLVAPPRARAGGDWSQGEGRERSGAPPVKVVARADEMGKLTRLLHATLDGETGVAFVSGEAGSGKTTLLEGFAASAAADHSRLLVAGARCNPGDSLDTLAPLRRLAEMLFGDLTSETAWRVARGAELDRLRKATPLLLSALNEHGRGLVETLVSSAASVASRGGRPDPLRMPSRQSQFAAHAVPKLLFSQGALFDQLVRTLAAISHERPLLILLDDLHWVDEASAAFLLHLGRELGRARVLVLGAYRSPMVALGRRDMRSGETVRHPLAGVVNELRVQKGDIVIELDRADGRAFVEAYVDTEPNRLGARFRDALYAQTGGHALFTVESLRNLQARGELYQDEAGRWVARDSLDWGTLPARVEAAIAERIERVPESCRRILSAASVQGNDFSAELVSEVTCAPLQDVLASLSGALARQYHLVLPEGVQRLGGRPHSVYRFSHHLFQKYLYDQLDPVERAQSHRAVASSLDRQVGDEVEERERLAARLAWHYESGGELLPAARALLDAGRQAMRVAAFREALDRFDHGLELLAKEPRSEERAELERLLEVARLGPERQLEGIASASLRRTFARASAALEGHPGRPQLLLLISEAERVLASGQLAEALAAAERLREQGLQAGEDDAIGFARLLAGMAHHFAGNARESEGHLAWLLAWLNPRRGTGLAAATGIHLQAQALAFSSMNQWLLGNAEQALTRGRQALAVGRASDATAAEAAALVLGANLLFLLRADPNAIAEQCEQCLRLCEQRGIGMWRLFAEVLLGWLMVDRGEELAGIARTSGAIAAWRDMDMVIAGDAYTVVLADGCLTAARRHPAGSSGALTSVRESVVATGLAAIEGITGPSRLSDGLAYEAELLRLRGELLLARDGLSVSEEALGCFRRSLELAREQGAPAWELRAAMSVVRLRARQGQACAAQLGGGAERPGRHLRAIHRGVCLPRSAGRRRVDWCWRGDAARSVT